MIDVRQIVELQRSMVVRWHSEPVSNPYHEFLGLVCQQHSFNYLLWHEEDIARSPDVPDSRIAPSNGRSTATTSSATTRSKSSTTALVERLQGAAIALKPTRRLNTETPGSAIDRLSIIALRMYHMEEQANRADATLGHRAKGPQSRLEILARQQHDLAQSLTELIDDIFSGRKRLEVYRQFKMYNDPTLNPYLYAAGEKNKVAG